MATVDKTEENDLRDAAFRALANREYAEAANVTNRLAAMQEKERHVSLRRKQLRTECDRLMSSRATLEERQELIEQTPAGIEDPYLGGVEAYLQKRHETALRLVAALDAEISKKPADDKKGQDLRKKREQLTIETDTLLKAMQVQEEREELLESAGEVMGDHTPDTSAYLRRILVYLDARSSIVLKLIANIDEQLGSKNGSVSEASREHLSRQRAELVSELDTINEKIALQKRGEAELKACGLRSEEGDPYHVKVTTYLQNKSDVALQLIAFLDRRLESLNDEAQRESLAAQKAKLQQEADATHAKIDQQEQAQRLMDSLGVAEKAGKAGYE